MGVGTGGAHSGNGAVDQPFVQRPEAFIVDAQIFRYAGPIVFQQHVGFPAKLVEDLATPGSLKIQGDAFLAPVVRPKSRRVSSQIPGAERVAAFRVFHLDHFGSHVCEQHGRIGSGDKIAQLQYSDSVQCTLHIPLLTFFPPGATRVASFPSNPAFSLLSLLDERLLSMAEHQPSRGNGVLRGPLPAPERYVDLSYLKQAQKELGF